MTGPTYEWLARVALCALACLAAAAPARAAEPHTIVPGDTLWSIAAASNLTTRALAAYNGLDEDADVVLGATIDVPTEAEAAAAMGGDPPSDSGGGDYVVAPGDTLSEIAERSGTSTERLADLNGLDADGLLIAGTGLALPGSGDSDSFSADAPSSTGADVSSADIIATAEANGVPGSLAAAIAWQESGFSNAVVSPAGALGVMQIMPETWELVESSLGAGELDPSSSQDNVKAGVLFLRYLLDQTGGDPERAAAAYYQGLGSVQSDGFLPETERYVANVTALRSRFGGP